MKPFENLAKMKKELLNLIACRGLNDGYNIYITIPLYSIQRWAQGKKNTWSEDMRRLLPDKNAIIFSTLKSKKKKTEFR